MCSAPAVATFIRVAYAVLAPINFAGERDQPIKPRRYFILPSAPIVAARPLGARVFYPRALAIPHCSALVF
jgi:hypothetical protein